MRKAKLAFLKVKKIKGDINEYFFNVEGALYSSMESLTAYDRMECAKRLYWIKENFYYEDVETPTDDVSLEEFQTDEGQKKYWNKYLTDLKAEYENGDIVGSIVDFIPAPNDSSLDECQICYVFEIGDKELFLMDETSQHDTDMYELFEFENVTSEYFERYLQTIDYPEIEEFVNTHTQDEIEEKYAIKWYKEHNDTSSMWEL